jgi:hypothetical protein
MGWVLPIFKCCGLGVMCPQAQVDGWCEGSELVSTGISTMHFAVSLGRQK